MNSTRKYNTLSIPLLLLPLLLTISTGQVSAAENGIENKTKTPEKTCLKFSELKPEERRTYTKCIKNTYDKGRCYKKVNLCLK